MGRYMFTIYSAQDILLIIGFSIILFFVNNKNPTCLHIFLNIHLQVSPRANQLRG